MGDDIGDVTDDERRKAEWYFAHFSAMALRIELGAANDNSPAMDDELADLLAVEWYRRANQARSNNR
jgi:hypothetical protein